MSENGNDLAMVPGAGLEPACPKTEDFKSDLASTAADNPWQAEEESRHFFPSISAVSLRSLCSSEPDSVNASGTKRAQSLSTASAMRGGR